MDLMRSYERLHCTIQYIIRTRGYRYHVLRFWVIESSIDICLCSTWAGKWLCLKTIIIPSIQIATGHMTTPHSSCSANDQRFYSDFGKSQQPLTQNKIREATKIKITKYKASKPNRFKVQWNRRNIKFNINHKKYISIEQIETRASLICLYSFFILLFFFSVARTTQYFFYSRLFNVFLFPFFSFFVVWCIVISLNILKRYLRRQKQVIGIYKKIKKPKRT